MGLKLFYHYKLALLNELIGWPIKNKVFKDAIKSAYTTITYRFPISAPKDALISLRIIKLIMANRFKKLNFELYNGGSGVAIFDVSTNASELRKNYVKRLSGEEIQLLVGRDNLLKSPNTLHSIVSTLAILHLAPWVIILSLFSLNRLKYPLHLLNSLEAYNMLWLLKKMKIRQLHFFCIYENDSNILAYVLMKYGITINKIPSEVPLQFLNRTIVADTLSFCFRYQEEEFRHFKSTMHVNKTQHWIPEKSFNLEACYNTTNRNSDVNTIGFYSSAMWLRSEIDTMDLANANDYEKELLEYLVEFVKINSKYKLIIFLHPIEKSNMGKARKYYDSFSVSFNFADVNTQNSKLFESADVVVSLYSTLAFERIFWGFKTIVFPLGQNDFPIKESIFNNTCAKAKNDLFNKLAIALETSTNDYFVKTGMADYRYLNYSCFKKNME